MSKIREEYGIYTDVEYCSDCDWFNKGSIKPYWICPKCGNKIKYDIGRYKYKITTRWFSEQNERVGYLLKEKE